MDTIEYLKTIPEKSGQLVYINFGDKIIACEFLWFLSENMLDLLPIGSIQILAVHKENWHKISIHTPMMSN